MAVLGARPFLAPAAAVTSCSSAVWEDSSSLSTSISFCGCLSSSAGEVSKRLNPGGLLVGTGGDSRGRLVVVSRAGGSRPAAGARRPRPQPSRRSGGKEDPQGDGTLLNGDIRVPTVRLLDEEQNMVGVVPTLEAQQRARVADLDLAFNIPLHVQRLPSTIKNGSSSKNPKTLSVYGSQESHSMSKLRDFLSLFKGAKLKEVSCKVMISPDADPPVCRIMDYSKYRYEIQKKKREAQKKATASRQDLKELKMRYNIDTHDYDVRLRAAKRFLKDGDKVKVVCQFKGREMDFKDLAFKLFQKFIDDIGELGIVESKMAIEGRQMIMMLGPNKTVVAKMQSTEKSKPKGQHNGKPNTESTVAETPKEPEPQKELENSPDDT